jgi:hypothetical protein
VPWPADPDERQALAESSLGPSIIEWSEGRSEWGPGLTDYQTGEPWRWTPGQKRFLILWYAVTEHGRWRFRSGVKRGAKGTGKDPFAGAWACVELLGPSRIDPGMPRDERGRLLGQQHTLPLVQVASNSEDQSKDVLRVANALLGRDARSFYGVDVGETRTILKDSGGRVELLTASEKSSEGDPATAIVLNESHHMTRSSGGHKVAAVARRNVGKSPAALQARLLECTNAHLMGMDSVAEQSYNAWQAQVSGRTGGKVDILYDSIEAPPSTQLHIPESRAAGLAAAYMDAPWADLERLNDEVLDPRTSEADSIRYYLNGLAAAEDAWVDPRRFDLLADSSVVLADRDQVALFLDCSKSEDATGLVGCRISDGHVFTVKMWQRPHGDRGAGWLAPRHEVDAAVRAMFDRFRVAWFGADPSPARDDEDEALYWGELVDVWHRDFRNKVAVWATPGAQGHAVKFDMRLSQPGGLRRNQAFTEEAMATANAVDTETRPFTHDGHPGLRMHVHNAKRRPNAWGYSLGKASRDSTDLVDLAVCMVGARLGRRLVLNSGKARGGRRTIGGRVAVMLS